MRSAMAVILPLWVSLAGAAAAQQDVVAKAIEDELARSMKQLQLEKLEKPYFIACHVAEFENRAVAARFGALTASNENRRRMLNVEVRVGDYKLDNTNFYSTASMMSGLGTMTGNAMLPLENDYRELRRQIWLTTDAAYKKAVEDLSRKRAALQNKTRTEETPDLSREEAAKLVEEAEPIKADSAQLERLVRGLSALFKEMPDVNSANVSLNISNSRSWYADSEGRSFTRVRPWFNFSARASTQAPDGMALEDSVSIYGRSLSQLPEEKELARRVREVGAHLKDLRAAAPIENYNGPVLFEAEGAAEAFNLLFAGHLLGVRRPITEGQVSPFRENSFLYKIGARVLSESLSVTDSPGLAEFNKTPLAGAYKVDDDGIPAREVKLVDKGILKTLLTTRNPVRGIGQSTGHRRGSGPAPSNLIVTAENGLTSAELREKFIGMLKSQGKEYGILVRSVGASPSRGQEPTLGPILAYKVFPDGREELIRSVEIAGLNVQSFKEIVAATKEQTVYSAPFRGSTTAMAAFSMVTSASDRIVSFVVPSLLFEDVTVKKISGEIPKPPVAKHPYFDR